MLLSVVSALITYPITLLGLSNLLTIVLGGLIGLGSYLVLNYIFKIRPFIYILSQVSKKKFKIA